MYNLGECVLIKNGFFASQEAKDLAEGKNIINFKPIGIIIKTPTDNDDFISKEESGEEYDMIDNYHIKLNNSPFISNIVTYISEDDLIKYEIDN